MQAVCNGQEHILDSKKVPLSIPLKVVVCMNLSVVNVECVI